MRLTWARFTDPTRRRAFARGLLRDLVADATGHPSSQVRLHQVCRECGGPHGRIVVRLPDGRTPAVSLSYTDSTIFAVVSLTASSLGIDAESDTARHRRAARDGLSALGLRSGGLAQWTRLEAVAKALGVGLLADFTGLTFAPDPSPTVTGPRPWRAFGPPLSATMEGFDLLLGPAPTPLLLSVAVSGGEAAQAGSARAATPATAPQGERG